MRVPVWPTWSVWLRQPLLVTAREQPTTPPSSVGELLQRGEALGRADAATAADHDRCGRQGDAGLALDAGLHDRARERRRRATRASGVGAAAPGAVGRCGVDGVVGDRDELDVGGRAWRPRAASRPSGRGSSRRAGRDVAADLGAVRRERQVEPGRRLGQHLVAAVGAGGQHDGGRQRARRPGRRPRPTPRGRSRPSTSSCTWWTAATPYAASSAARRVGRGADGERLDACSPSERAAVSAFERGGRERAPVVLDDDEHGQLITAPRSLRARRPRRPRRRGRGRG